jgi:hypothetical protein
MAGSRTLKLSILADVADLKKNLDSGSKEVEGFGGKLEKFGKVAAAAFAAAAAAAAAYAVKLAVDGVKAAIEDEAAQKRLANALENVTGATEAQIAAVEKQILKTSLATGVSDDQLRPALQRLATATGSVTQSQDLLNLALDISAATGKSVESVSNALGKAYEGNTGALTRLGVGLSAAEIKTLGLEGTVKQLADTFGGAATVQANTFEGRIARLKVTFDETKESVGTALLPIIEKLLTFITDTAIPAFERFKKNAIDPVIKSVKENEDTFRGLYNFAKDTLVPFLAGGFADTIKIIGKVASGIVSAVAFALNALEPIINAAITGINAVIRGLNLIKSGPDIKTIPKVDFDAGTKSSNTVASASLPFGVVVTPKVTTTPSVTITPVTPAKPNVVSPSVSSPSLVTAPSTIVPSGNAIPSSFDVAAARRGDERGNVVINVNAPSAIDEEGFTRAVVLALNTSNARNGGGGAILGGLVAQ